MSLTPEAEAIIYSTDNLELRAGMIAALTNLELLKAQELYTRDEVDYLIGKAIDDFRNY